MSTKPLWIVDGGLSPYRRGLETQLALAEARRRDQIPDLLLLLEHYPVYTKGRRSKPEELPMGEDWYRMQGIEVCETDRGGLVTYHGPGQLVGYPIIDLGPGADVVAYVRGLEDAMISALATVDIEAEVFDGLTGVWTAGDPPIPIGEPGPQGSPVRRRGPEPFGSSEARKIGSIGVHLSKGVTTHGFALNVNNDLQPFEWIVPCGIEYCRMTSVAREHRAEQDLPGFAASMAAELSRALAREPVRREAAEVAAEVAGASGLVGAVGSVGSDATVSS